MISRDVHIDEYPHIMLDTPANSIVQQVKGIRPDLLTRFIPQAYFIYTQSDIVDSVVPVCAILRSDRMGQLIIKTLGNILIGRNGRSTRHDNLRYHIGQIMATPIYTDHSDGFDNSSIQTHRRKRKTQYLRPV